MNKFLLLFIIVVFINNIGKAQKLRHFQTAEFEKEIFEVQYSELDYQEFRNRTIAFENYFENEFLYYEEIKKKNIGLVLNVISNGINDVSEEQIIQQIGTLNAAFRGEMDIPEDDFFRDKQVDAEIEFCLFGLDAPYVRRKNIPGILYNDFNSMTSDLLGLEAYNPDEFINIWICDLEELPLLDKNAAGFAELPLRHGTLDGVVIDMEYFGRNEMNSDHGEGKTLVHLIANYLGLKPLYGFSNCEDDDVDDTPIHSGEIFFCTQQKESVELVSSCHGWPRMMTRNFMANVPDACAAMFTEGQKQRMHAFLGEKGPLIGLVLVDDEACLIKSDDDDDDDDDEQKRVSGENLSVSEHQIKLYPVPADKELHILIHGDVNASSTFSIKNISGQTKLAGSAKTSFSINIEAWESGIYYFILNTNGMSISQTFTVTH